jgi:hypothetical protein
MISQPPVQASENNKLENLISRMQLPGALLSHDSQAMCPRREPWPVDDLSRAHRHISRTRSRAAALMPHDLPWAASPRVNAA